MSSPKCLGWYNCDKRELIHCTWRDECAKAEPMASYDYEFEKHLDIHSSGETVNE